MSKRRREESKQETIKEQNSKLNIKAKQAAEITQKKLEGKIPIRIDHKTWIYN